MASEGSRRGNEAVSEVGESASLRRQQRLLRIGQLPGRNAVYAGMSALPKARR